MYAELCINPPDPPAWPSLRSGLLLSLLVLRFLLGLSPLRLPSITLPLIPHLPHLLRDQAPIAPPVLQSHALLAQSLLHPVVRFATPPQPLAQRPLLARLAAVGGWWLLLLPLVLWTSRDEPFAQPLVK